MNKYWTIAFDDNADGDAYPKNHITSPTLSQAFADALYLLGGHDHVCIVSDMTVYNVHAVTFKQVAKYSLVIEKGHYFKMNPIVNKL